MKNLTTMEKQHVSNHTPQSDFSIAEFQALAQSVLSQAKAQGATQVEVGIAANKGFSVAAHQGDVETVEYHQDKAIEIQVYFGKRAGNASISDIRPEAVKDAVIAACHIAKYTDEDPYSGLADSADLALTYEELPLYFPWEISVPEAIDLACQCEREALTYDKRIMSAEETSVATANSFHLYANSNGFMGGYPTTHHEISCVLIAKEKEDMQRDFSYTVACHPEDLMSISEIAKIAAERTVKRLGARRLSTRKAPVIFMAEEARVLLGHFTAAISGHNLYKKSSFLIDALGKQLFPDIISIRENPFLPRGRGSAPFDGDGVATRENIFVKNGVLESYVLSTYSARKLGLKSTGNAGGTHNLIVSHSDKNLTDMLKEMGTGFLATELMGQGISIISGDYSRGASGFWVENGEIQYPVSEITIAGNLRDMYNRIVTVGNDVDTRGNIRTGSILISEMMIAGN